MWTNFERFRPVFGLASRMVLGAILLAHGWGKVVPRGSLYNFAHIVSHMGLPYWLGYVAAFTEFFGGMALILGLLTPLVALAVVVEMTVVILKAHLGHRLTGSMGFRTAAHCARAGTIPAGGRPGILGNRSGAFPRALSRNSARRALQQLRSGHHRTPLRKELFD